MYSYEKGASSLFMSSMMSSVKVASASSSAVNGRLFGGWGSLSPGTGLDDARLCAVSGSSNGQDVIALLDMPPPAMPFASVTPRESMVFSKPVRMSHNAAAQLPFLALTAAAALLSAGLPPGSDRIGTLSSSPATVVIAGSSGRLPSLLVQLLAARGACVYVAAQDDERTLDSLRRLGAAKVFNHQKESFSAELATADVVLDCVGLEASSQCLTQTMGAIYVSAASPELRRLEADGVAAGLTGWWDRRGRAGADGSQSSIWKADELAASALREILELIEAGKIEPPGEAIAAKELSEQYIEYVTWARDVDSGLRCESLIFRAQK